MDRRPTSEKSTPLGFAVAAAGISAFVWAVGYAEEQFSSGEVFFGLAVLLVVGLLAWRVRGQRKS